ncbi:hypothetical protein ACVIIV_000981 [Bradyrhizobium sp. USDA 4354]
MSTFLRLQTADLDPEMVSRITAAYKQALHTLCIEDRDDHDPLADVVARKVIEIAQSDIHDPADIAALAVKRIEIR